LRADLAAFFKALRAALGGQRLPYIWVPEWHHTDHGLHAHFAVDRYISRSVIAHAWGHGFVHIKLLSDLPVGSGRLAEARRAAGYLSKYVSKTFDRHDLGGLHRYEVGQGFQPAVEHLAATSSEGLLEQACQRMGAEPIHTWSSADEPKWKAPPAVWFAWA
jgi:hypothetical protein